MIRNLLFKIMKIFYKKNINQGFTIIELLVVITLFTTVMLLTTGIYTRFSTAERKLKIQNELYEETRFVLERIVKEFREGTLDYEEYWNQTNTVLNTCTPFPSRDEIYGQYGQCYGDYANQFYAIDINTGQNPKDATNLTEQLSKNAVSITGTLDSDYEQEELYIINNSGNKKTLLRCVDCDGNPNNPGRLQILRLIGFDTGYNDTINAANNDGKIDTWLCAKDFTCNGTLSDGTSSSPILANNSNGWMNYSPPTIDITNLKFFIAPLEDPHKAYNDNDSSIQMQPHITIVITGQISQEKAQGTPGKSPAITLQTTVSGRVFNEVK